MTVIISEELVIIMMTDFEGVVRNLISRLCGIIFSHFSVDHNPIVRLFKKGCLKIYFGCRWMGAPVATETDAGGVLVAGDGCL